MLGARCLPLGPDVNYDGQNKRDALNDALRVGRNTEKYHDIQNESYE
jgi:hypothetical protein